MIRDCNVCGGDGWLASRPSGEAECPYCMGTGKVVDGPGYRCQWCEHPCSIEENQSGACDECSHAWDVAWSPFFTDEARAEVNQESERRRAA